MVLRRSKSCCPPARLKELLEDRLAEGEQAEVAAHLETCRACRQTLERLAAESRWWGDARLLMGHDIPPTIEGGKSDGDATRLVAARDHDPTHEQPSLDFLDPPADPAHLGRLGAYEVTEVIGRGGMGLVLKALDPSLNRYVAIKVLAPELATSATARRRFAREAQAAAAIAHEHIVAIHAVDTTSSTLPYLVMQYVSGRSLQDRLDRTGPLETREILRIGMQTASGLAAAHGHGLIHRDIKPANILLENCIERVKITDFGLARAVDDASVTQSGVVAGTPQYMAPEQARGDSLDHRADLFSLGSVLYAMCTGRAPFRAGSAIAILRRVSDDTPTPIHEVNADIPAWLVEIIDKLHAKDPADRFQSSAEVAELLGQHLAHLQHPETSPRPPRLARAASSSKGTHSRPRLRAALVATLLAALGLGAAEATGFTQITDFVATVLRIRTPEGILVVEVNDPEIKVKLDGKELVITGGGPQEIRLTAGVHELREARPGEPEKIQPIVISRGGKQVASIGLEPGGAATAESGEGAGVERLRDRLQSVEAQLEAAKRAARGRQDPQIVALHDRIKELEGELARREAASGGAMEPRGGSKAPAAQGGSAGMSRGSGGMAAGMPAPTIPASGAMVLDGSRGMVYGRGVAGGSGGGVLYGGTSPSIPAAGGSAATPGPRTPGMTPFAGVGRTPGVGIMPAPVGEAQPGPAGNVSAVIRMTAPPGIPGHPPAPGTGTPYTKITPNAPIYGVAVSPDGTLLAMAAGDNVIQLWDLAEHRPRRALEGHTMRVWSVAFSPDGETLASAAGEFGPRDQPGEVKLWDVAAGRPRADLKGHTATAFTVAFSPDGKTLASGAWDGTARLWDPENGQERATLAGHDDAVRFLAFSPDGETLATAGFDGQVKLWDPATGKERGPLLRSKTGVNCLAFSPDGKTLATCPSPPPAEEGPRPSEVTLWDVAGRKERAVLKGHRGNILAVAFSPDGKVLAAAGGAFAGSGELTLWDPATGRRHAPVQALDLIVECLAFSPDGKVLVSGGGTEASPGEVRLWNLTRMAKAQPKVTFRSPAGTRVWSVRFAPGGRTIVTGAGVHEEGASGFQDDRGRLAAYDVTTRRPRFDRDESQTVRSVAFSPDGRILAAASFNRPVTLRETSTGKPVRELEGPESGVNALAFSPDGTRLVGAGLDNDVRVWEVATGRVKLTLQGHTASVYAVAFSPDGRTIVSGGDDQSARLWDAETGEAKTVLQGHENTVEFVTFSPDSQIVATTSWDATIKLWNVAQGRELATLRGHTLPVLGAEFSPDGKTLATCGGTWGAFDPGPGVGELKIWAVASRTEQASLNGHEDRVFAVAFTPDGETLATASWDGTVKLWDMKDLHKTVLELAPAGLPLGAPAAPLSLPSLAPSGAVGLAAPVELAPAVELPPAAVSPSSAPRATPSTPGPQTVGASARPAPEPPAPATLPTPPGEPGSPASEARPSALPLPPPTTPGFPQAATTPPEPPPPPATPAARTTEPRPPGSGQ